MNKTNDIQTILEGAAFQTFGMNRRDSLGYDNPVGQRDPLINIALRKTFAFLRKLGR